MEDTLKLELRRLQQKLSLGLELNAVRWLPDGDPKLSGRIVGETVYVYEKEPGKALDTLRHEVVDHAITIKVISPLTSLVNLLVKDRADQVYREKEQLVKHLTRLLWLPRRET